MKLDFRLFPKLETKRLLLRQFILSDAADLFEIRSNPDVIDFTDQKLDEYIEDSIKFINIINLGIEKQKWINWAIVHKDTNKMIGSINLWNFNKNENKAEVGYSLNPLYQGKGLMSEALEKVIDYGLNVMELGSIEAWTEKRNLKSIKLLERNNFKYLRVEKEMGYYKKQNFYMNVYEINKR